MPPLPPLDPRVQPASPTLSIVPLDQVVLDPVVTMLADGSITVVFGTLDHMVELVGSPLVIATALADVVQALAVATGAA